MKKVYYNGLVYTGQLPLCQAFVVENDKFIFAGSNEEALSMAADEKNDLQGAFVCAGFNDSHMHLLSYGQTLKNAALNEHTGSLEDMISYLKAFAEENKERAWIVGRGWNQDCFADMKRMPNRWDLDKASLDKPICAVRACGHALAVNSKTLELIGVTANTPQPEGGQIGMENGEPNGQFFDNALELVYSAIPAPTKNELKDMIRSACKALNSYGVTSSQTDDYCVFSNVPWQDIDEAYKELEQAGELSVRVYEQANFTSLDKLKEYAEAGKITGTGSELYKMGPLKMLGDGALGPRTAFLSENYADAEGKGIPVFSQETFDEMIGYANRHNMQCAIHAIGDACLDRVLSAIEKALKENPREDHRHGIVHCQITRPDQLEKIAELKLHVYAQSIFLDYDIHIIPQRISETLAKSSYNWKSLMNKGVTVSNGTDCPVELPFALGGIQCAVTRNDLKCSAEAYLPQEAFTVQEALDSYTAAGAYSSFEENIKGKIAPGMLADFVVLGGNPFDADKDKIKDIPVLATYLGGKKVY
ncbi:MAG: amidohydrolase [Oscillospiraceae bacterium]|nr:amidohydrolase [Oscillospiraceae bacterium]